MSNVDTFVLGDYNAACAECGRKFKASQLLKHWKGYYVCPEHWESRHPQDFADSSYAGERNAPEFVQPQTDVFVDSGVPDFEPFDPTDA